jgi:type II secretion system protein N
MSEEKAEAPPAQEGLIAPVSSDLDEDIKFGIGQLASLKSPTSNWDEDVDQSRSKGSSRLKRIFWYTALGLASFLFFLYVTFPYGVVKEVIVERATRQIQASGLPIRLSIGSLEPYWLTGIQMENVNLTNVTSQNANLRLGIIRARIKPLSLLIGQIGVNLYMTQVGGSLDVDVNLPLSSLIAGTPSPSSAAIDVKSFSVDPFFNHALALAAASTDPAMILVAPLLSKTSIGGQITGQISFSNDNPEHFGNAKGNFEISVSDGFLHIADETLKIRRQTFEKANLDLSFENNALVIGDQTLFAAQDIEIGLNGRLTLPNLSRQAPQANFNLVLTMRDKIEESLGFIVPNMLRCPALANGVLKANLSGPLSSMSCTGQ